MGWLAGVLMGIAAAFGSATASSAASVGEPPIRVELRSTIDVSPASSGTFSSVLTLRVPAQRSDAKAVVGSRPGSDSFRRGMQSILIAAGLLSAHPETDRNAYVAFQRLQESLSDAMRRRIEDEDVVLELVSDNRLAAAIAFGQGGLWQLRWDWKHVGLRFLLPWRIPRTAKWTVSLDSRGRGFVRLRPTPEDATGSVATWRLGHEAPPFLATEVDVAVTGAVEMAATTQRWNALPGITSYLWRLVLFIGAGCIARSWQGRKDRARPVRIVANAAVIATGLATAGLAVERAANDPRLRELPPALAGLGIFVLSVAALRAAGAPKMLGVGLAVAAIAAGLVVIPYVDYRHRVLGAWEYFGGSVAYTATLALAAALALASILVAAIRTGRGKMGVRASRTAYGIAAFASVLVAFQAFWASSSTWARYASYYALLPRYRISRRLVDLTYTGTYYPQALLGLLLSLMPLALLVLLLALMAARGGRGDLGLSRYSGAIVPQRRRPWRWLSRAWRRRVFVGTGRTRLVVLATAIFATFVVGSDGELFGYELPLAFLLSLGLFSLALRSPESVRVPLHAARRHTHSLKATQAQLLSRATQLDLLRRRRTRAYESLDETSPSAARAYTAALEDIDDARTRLLGRKRKSGSLSPGNLALSLGPGRNWWRNGVAAVTIAAPLSLIPIAFYLYSAEFVEHRASNGTLGGGYLLQGFLYETAFWLSAAFVLGAVYPHLRGPTGAAKAAALASVFAVSHATATWALPGPQPSWLFRAVELLVFLAVVGVAVDLQTLREHKLPWQHIVDRYQARDIRVVLTYASPLLVSLVIIVGQIRSGNAQSAVTEILKAIPNIPYVPTRSG